MYHFQESHNIHQRVKKLRSVQEEAFLQYLHKQRRTNHWYYDILCKLKIDFITFSVYLNKRDRTTSEHDETQLIPMFNDIWFNRTKEPNHHYHRRNKYNFSTDYHFEFEGTEHQLITAKCSWDNYRPILITIHDPTPEVLLYLQEFLGKMDYYHLKDVEFTYDFLFEDTGMAKQYFQEHAIVAWRGKGYDSDNDTFYANNIRFASGKGLRAYEKEVQDEDGVDLDVARLEMRLKRPILKKNGLHNITDLFTMDNRIANKYWAFQSFNFKKLSKRMIEENEILYQYEDVRNNIIGQIKEGYLYEMNQYCKDWCKRYNSDSYIKKNKFWDHFKFQFQGCSFLNGGSFKLSSFLMEDGV